jgi:hypothetical protein
LDDQGRCEIKREHFPAWPLQFLNGPDGFFYVCQKAAPLFNTALPQDETKRYKPFSVYEEKIKAYISYNQRPYRADWQCEQTWKGAFGFGYRPSTENKTQSKAEALIAVIEKYQKEHGTDQVIPTSAVLEGLERSKEWLETYKDMREEALEDLKKEDKTSKDKPQEKKKRKINAIKPEHIASFRLLVRMLATMEMALHDPESCIVIRDNNRHDFKAAIKLFEKVFLPLYCGFMSCSGLFSDYSAVEPFPSWHFWEDIERTTNAFPENA